MSEIKFKRDTSFRKQFFVPDSFAHPAKMDAQLLIWIVEHYTEAGDIILDPMAGSGTTMLACGLGRNVILVELEEKFCKMCRDNWEQVKMKPQLGSTMGTCQIIQGDARNLEGLLVDKCIFSPPFSEQGAHEVSKYFPRKHRGTYDPKEQSLDNIGNLPYGSIDSVITSPPYEGSLDRWGGISQKEVDKRLPQPYTDKVDAILTSPPYEGSISGKDGQARQREVEYVEAHGRKVSLHSTETMPSEYSPDADNIGNLKSISYLEAMSQVYQQCYRVLKSQGLMILVTKNFIRKQKEIRLDLDTIVLAEKVGFVFQERWYRELPAQSFWRVTYHKHYPNAPELKFEDVLIFRKG